MDNHSKEIFGSAITVVGTIASATGSTPSSLIKKEFLNELNLYGNVLQALGNALQADGQGELSLELIGNNIQAIGNVTVISGTVLNFEEKTQQKLNITGNWLQALGGTVALGDEFEDTTEAGRSENIIGNLLQSIGNSLQALGGIDEMNQNNQGVNNDKGEHLTVNGSWIQAVGSVLTFIGQTKEETQEIAQNQSLRKTKISK